MGNYRKNKHPKSFSSLREKNYVHLVPEQIVVVIN